MKAIVQERYGSPDDLELREVDKPVVGKDEVLVRVRAASIHPDVWHVVAGRPYVLRLRGAGFSNPRNPIPGTDMAGIVESVGKSVTRFQPGDPARTASDQLIRRPARPAGAGRAGPFSRTARRGHREEAELRVVAVAVEIEPPSSRRGGLPLERLRPAGAGGGIQGVPAVHEVADVSRK